MEPGRSSAAAYALPQDFRRIFDSAMPNLHLLALLLTGDQQKAEQCFVTGLEDCMQGNPVFKEWARSWAKRTIVRRAIGMMSPVIGHDQRNPANPSLEQMEQIRFPYLAIVRLAPFERFVFVMTVLERYSDQQSSELLDCTRKNVADARVRALQQLSLQSIKDPGNPIGCLDSGGTTHKPDFFLPTNDAPRGISGKR